MPGEGARALYVCALAERFGQNPLDVLEWPSEVMRIIEIDSLMQEQLRSKET